MPVQIIDCAQNSEEWHRARMGIPTASAFATICASGRGGGESKTRRKYMMKLAGEIITGEPMENYSNIHMERGHAMEEEARSLYAFLQDVEPERVGFIRNGQKGGSPDALIGTNGVLEIKTALPDIMAEYLLADKFPSEHVAQCQGNLWISEREWIDIIVFWPKMPPLIKRAYRDETYIRRLTEEVDLFNSELQDVVSRLRRYGEARIAA